MGSSFLLTCKERPNHLLAYVKRLSAHPGASAFSGRKSRCRWQHGPPDGKGIPGWSSRARSISQVAFPWAQELDPIFSPLKAKGQGGAARRECQTGLMCFVREKERHSTAGLPCSLTLHRCSPVADTHCTPSRTNPKHLRNFQRRPSIPWPGRPPPLALSQSAGSAWSSTAFPRDRRSPGNAPLHHSQPLFLAWAVHALYHPTPCPLLCPG